MRIKKQDLKKSIREEIIEILSGDNNPMTDQIFALINQANLSDDAKEVMMKWMERTDNPQAIIDYLEGTMNESTTIVDKNTNPQNIKDKDPITVKSAIDTAKKTNKPVTIAEEDDDEMDKKAIKAASSGKKDSIVSLANQLVKVATEMKKLAQEYKSAKEGKETEKEKEILAKLKELTSKKKSIESKLQP
jgi:hypothetical protein